VAESSPEYTFHTQRPPGETFCFTIQADSHLDGPIDAKLYLQSFTNALAAQPDFRVDLGDKFMTDSYGTDSRARSAGGWRRTFDRERYEWLANALKTSDAAFKFVFTPISATPKSMTL